LQEKGRSHPLGKGVEHGKSQHGDDLELIESIDSTFLFVICDNCGQKIPKTLLDSKLRAMI
jgi:hypothetical protein